ncbi:MAG: hypothetical protein CVV23_03260 [Ignavibacteriae bacterium HGW-Ignavibacteriae-2]|jgi:hypothetical protein|nr:H-type lectin domain-containing protein [Bacteroidota bacterium]PKL89855.1 MAG: hypothetical protein CVV23_03260 [Ignavibacteriae bacterium HGW-Ignavibacteriae-2]
MKKSFLFLSVLLTFFFATNLFAQNFQTGKFSGNYQSEGFNLNKGEGKRTYSVEVKFKKAYEVAPTIILTVNHLNAETKDGVRVRYEVTTKGISRDGFLIEVATWEDSKIHEIRGDWVAFNE